MIEADEIRIKRRLLLLAMEETNLALARFGRSMDACAVQFWRFADTVPNEQNGKGCDK